MQRQQRQVRTSSPSMEARRPCFLIAFATCELEERNETEEGVQTHYHSLYTCVVMCKTQQAAHTVHYVDTIPRAIRRQPQQNGFHDRNYGTAKAR